MGEAVTSFNDLGLDDDLVEACHELNWKSPTKIQLKAIPEALEGDEDLVVVSQSGTGKTGAFALPILQSLLRTPRFFFACVLSPTSELAIQISEQFKLLGSGIGAMSVALVDGKSHVGESLALAKKPHIVVATPDSLVYHLENTEGFSFRLLRYLVLDEADMMLNEGFKVALYNILKFMPQERRTFLFSATKVEQLKSACLRNPVKEVEVKSKRSTVDKLEQRYCLLPEKQKKDCYVVYILKENPGSKFMVFTRTSEDTRLLAFMLRYLGYSAIAISGQMTQEDRLGALNKFKGGECSVLICTDVASRGLDIPDVDMVIIYDIPANSKDYIHRVGRTARAGRSGTAISLITENELNWYRQIEKLIGVIYRYPPPKKDDLPSLETIKNAKRIAQKIEVASTLKQHRCLLHEKHKDCYLFYILKEKPGSTFMVFTRTCEATRLLALMLRDLGFSAIPISGQMTQEDRLGALKKFEGRECSVLICSDEASRGLDIPAVDMVIMYGISAKSKGYIHRVWRIARAGSSGMVILLISEDDILQYVQLENLIGKVLPRYRALEKDVLPFLERTKKAKRKAQKEARETGGKNKRKGGGDDDAEEGDRKLKKKPKR